MKSSQRATCAHCGDALRRSQTYRGWGKLIRYLGIKPFRCRSCRALSYHFSPRLGGWKRYCFLAGRRSYSAMNNHPTEGFHLPQPSHPLLCAHCGVVFGLSSGVTDGAVVTCHHCRCQNQISLAKPAAEASGPSIRLIEQSDDNIVPDTNICE